MLTGVHPYAGRTVNDTIENIKKGKMVAPLPDYIKGELKEMLLAMLDQDMDKRPTAKELLDSDIMLQQANLEKQDGKEAIEDLLQKNKELEAKVRNLEIEKEKEK
ncbi:MAG: hypothetical protein EZS28_026485 [Streblomastix strix]|uniref:Protein kinase domain-containing protein n=1 Tax=Streblomastix strix TaxID=222440 RepID=A0A5J4V716_9EUKA|nr:MAG: hypothetical protein EZS28_026485 [Streblomastix strix]